MARVDKALKRQIDANARKNMLYAELGQTMEIDPDFLAALEELLASDEDALTGPALRDAISAASSMVLQRLYSINQFIRVDEQNLRRLESIYLRTWRRIVETRDIQSALMDHHYPELASWIASLYPRSFLRYLRASPAIGHVVCEEYSARTQMKVLRLDAHALKQPIIDIGCGNAAHLVGHLRRLGMDAFGFDRRVEKKAAFLQQKDWFDYRFERAKWGTVISNMAFTNHLLYACHNDRARLREYSFKFNEILESLTIGGSFHYAPSVPYLEDSLEAKAYSLERFEVMKDISMTKITRQSQGGTC